MPRIVLLLLTLCVLSLASAATVVLDPSSCPQTVISLAGLTGTLKLDQTAASTGRCDWRFTGPANTQISLKPTVLCIDCNDILQSIDTSSGAVLWDAQAAHSAHNEDPYCKNAQTVYCNGLASPPSSEVTSDAITLRYEKKGTARPVELLYEYQVTTVTSPGSTNIQSTPGSSVTGSGRTTLSNASFLSQSWVFLAVGVSLLLKQ